MSSLSQVTSLKLRDYSTYLWATAFVAGNVVFPQLCHIVPMAGKVLLPIMLFTVIAAVRFGFVCALLTALISPLVCSLLFAMPTGIMLVAVLTKSVVIAFIFGLWKHYNGGFSLLSIFMLAVAVQFICFVLEGALMFGFDTSWADMLISYPGVLLQVAVAMIVLKCWK